MEFIKYLQAQRPGQRIVLIWDGASYHKSDEVKKFLATANGGHEQEQWQITCIRFAPNAPEQNPVEDVWLQAKNFVRKYWHLGKSFNLVKWLFKFFTNHQKFDFTKLHRTLFITHLGLLYYVNINSNKLPKSALLFSKTRCFSPILSFSNPPKELQLWRC